MHRLAKWFCACALLAPRALEAQPGDVRRAEQIADSTAITALAARLTGGAPTDSVRAARIYEWVARNVSYDVASYRRGEEGHATAESVFRHRRTVCSGFVALYLRLAREAGLQARAVSGYAKGFDHSPGRSTRKPNHAWVAVAVDGHWRLVDPTWGAGTVKAGRFEPQFSWDYFLVDPEVLLLSHFPEDVAWQLVTRPLRRAEFEHMPAVPAALLKLGFSATTLRSHAAQGPARDFPAAGQPDGATVVSAPVAGSIRRAELVPVQIRWPAAVDMALVTGDAWTPLTRAGDVFHGQVVAAGGSLYVVGRASRSQPYETLLLYQVH